MSNRTRTVELNEEKIDRIAGQDFLWDARSCDLEGDDYGVHTWMKMELRYEGERLVAERVVDCDRKGGA
ncbi:hypothetical protein [Streptomyces sp. 5-10]|uniref:hypothetical protein n=1 Tax=Streptomyces sp. 5-10 TaxID=878925 RepID=UPI00168B8F00|nr:hypothetical protein [Streptomyces sp. 5-10]MBD3004604.1 hypothetical protein [Streptomyces sp. 5-10]